MSDTKRALITACVFFPLAVAGAVFIGLWVAFAAVILGCACVLVTHFGLHRVFYNEKSKKQRVIYALVMLGAVLFSLFTCAVSIESEWLHDYPLPGSVDGYGCYPQMFDAFMKGRLDIDTDYDLTKINALENPYNTSARRKATGETFGVLWDRAYYNGKIYSYFGIAPVVFLYFPVYALTGRVLSDALAAAIIAAVASVALMLLLRQLCARLKYKVPFLLMCAGAACLPFGALLYSTVTCANFYHIAVLAGVAAVSCAFAFLLGADRAKGIKRKLLFACAGVCAAATVASRPNLALYFAAALPLIAGIIITRPNGTKSMLLDAAAFAVPLFALGALIMLYNAARFGSPFDFGNDYQLTLWDMSGIYASAALTLPALFHYFLHPPVFNGTFPFLHPNGIRLESYGVTRPVYVSGTVGALWFPCVYGLAFLPYALKGSGKKAWISAGAAAAAVLAVVLVDMNYAGVHLRYAADIMFVLALGGVFACVAAVGRLLSGKKRFADIYAVVLVLFAVTAAVDIALCFDNERDMIYKFHTEFYNAVKALF
ncbi:MAG: hypothetical protein J5925_06490 [Clostridia bacterium]|nr:hypothetical protein [Clostridia bacterium]